MPVPWIKLWNECKSAETKSQGLLYNFSLMKQDLDSPKKAQNAVVIYFSILLTLKYFISICHHFAETRAETAIWKMFLLHYVWFTFMNNLSQWWVIYIIKYYFHACVQYTTLLIFLVLWNIKFSTCKSITLRSVWCLKSRKFSHWSTDLPIIQPCVRNI